MGFAGGEVGRLKLVLAATSLVVDVASRWLRCELYGMFFLVYFAKLTFYQHRRGCFERLNYRILTVTLPAFTLAGRNGLVGHAG